jgi:hypothetical protein
MLLERMTNISSQSWEVPAIASGVHRRENPHHRERLLLCREIRRRSKRRRQNRERLLLRREIRRRSKRRRQRAVPDARLSSTCRATRTT